MTGGKSLVWRRGCRAIALPAPAHRALLVAMAAAVLCPIVARGAELELRAECRCGRTVVTLGDVAGVHAADAREADSLRAIELFPSPPPDAKRFLRLRELQDLLVTRGVDLLEHRFSGSSQVVIVGPADNLATPGGRGLSASLLQRAEARVGEAIVQYLQHRAPEAQPLTVDVRLDDAQAKLVASAEGTVSVRGGTPPWAGIQRFEVRTDSPEGPSLFAVDARVRSMPGVVVAAKSLARGAVIRAVDVQLEQGETLDPLADGFRSIDQVIGRETTRAIPAGEILRRTWIRQPLLVRRGEVVEVYARSAGVRVRTLARAREDGSLGDLIEVESLRDRATYFARVSGIQEVDVFARPIQADVATAPGSVRGAEGGIPIGRSRQGASSRRSPEPAPQLAARPGRPSTVPLDLADKMRNLYLQPESDRE